MALFPEFTTFTDITQEFFNNSSAAAQGFSANTPPSVSGFGTRQSRLPNNRVAQSTKNVMKWMVPEGPIIEMYLNPQNVRINQKKGITRQRTKGGYVAQYWGPELQELSISGTTGTSGIEGINVLEDIYLNEQLAFDPYAISLTAKKQQNSFDANIFGSNSALATGADFVTSLFGSTSNNSPADFKAPSLASLAFTVEMYWSGVVYRGWFESFSVTEAANELGLFNYDISFTATQKRGFRQNFLAWHRSATSGHVNSNPQLGTPYSFSELIER